MVGRLNVGVTTIEPIPQGAYKAGVLATVEILAMDCGGWDSHATCYPAHYIVGILNGVPRIF